LVAVAHRAAGKVETTNTTTDGVVEAHGGVIGGHVCGECSDGDDGEYVVLDFAPVVGAISIFEVESKQVWMYVRGEVVSMYVGFRVEPVLW
jgi:hypothetical protein